MGVPFISNNFLGSINVLLTFSFEYSTQSEINCVITTEQTIFHVVYDVYLTSNYRIHRHLILRVRSVKMKQSTVSIEQSLMLDYSTHNPLLGFSNRRDLTQKCRNS